MDHGVTKTRAALVLACAFGASVAAAQPTPPTASPGSAPAPQPAAPGPLARFSDATGTQPPRPWRVVTLPKQPRHTGYSIVELDGARVLRVAADASYANLLHEFDAAAAIRTLRWRWRVDRFADSTDLTIRTGDDAAARVCVLYDVPAARLAWHTRVLLAFWRSAFDPRLPAATVCYVWDATLAAGTWLPNAYTDRVRMLVLHRGDAGRWFDEARDLAADFAAAFPRESQGGLPPVAAIGIGGDADNTQGRSLAWFGDFDIGTPSR